MKKIILIILYLNINFASSIIAQSCEKTASITVTIRHYNLSIVTKQTDYCEADELNLESSFGLAKNGRHLLKRLQQINCKLQISPWLIQEFISAVQKIVSRVSHQIQFKLWFTQNMCGQY
ncbi:MAG: hypothetical protein IPJ43_09155 [Saprospiraceae bacterium]|nr:hypothetical protein [Saprospiraceae bacterium]